MTQRKKQILPTPSRGTGKTYLTRSESDARCAKNMSYLYSLEAKSIKGFVSTAKTYFTITQDAVDNEKSFDKVFDVLTKFSKNKMKNATEINNMIKSERVKRKLVELELKELKTKLKKKK